MMDNRPVQLFFLFLSFIIASCNKEKGDGEYSGLTNQNATYIDGYMGDANCVECHEQAYKDWKGSHHDLAMQVAADSTILGNFDDHRVSLDKVDYHFFKENGKFFVEVKEIDGTLIKYQISFAFGYTPLQQYLIDFEKGKKQVLRVTWDTVNKKWFHQYEGQTIATHDWLHWTNRAQNWNTMCAECHSTNLKKNYNVEKDSFNTTYSVINVSCESCHGPGVNHVSWAREGKKGKDPWAGQGKLQTEQLNICAPCHARRSKLTENLVPGMNFTDQYLLQNLTTDFYHGDGQFKDEDYELGSFMQSAMYKNNIKCNDCHNIHSLKLKKSGNALCLQCHVPKYDTPEHHFHKQNTEESLCVNCHMTGKYYMGNDFRRDHSFRVPRPDQSVVYKTPNACTGCHKDKTDQWAADYVVKWYGSRRKDHFSDLLLLSTQENLNDADRKKIEAFITDLNYPAIARATAIDNLNYDHVEQLEALLPALNDASPLVRYSALMEFRSTAPQQRQALAVRASNDPTRLLRIGAAQLTIGLDINTLQTGEQAALKQSQSELETMLNTNSDFATGRLQLGDYYMQKNDLKTAIKHYNMAINLDSLLLPVYSNLASAYSLNGENEKALKTLNTYVRFDPASARPYFLRALIYFEMNQKEKAENDLIKATQLDRKDSRIKYNLATYYFQEKQYNKAVPVIKEAINIEPQNPDYKYLLALIYQAQGKTEAYQLIMNELNQ